MNFEFEDNIPIPKADDVDKDDKNYDTDEKEDSGGSLTAGSTEVEDNLPIGEADRGDKGHKKEVAK